MKLLLYSCISDDKIYSLVNKYLFCSVYQAMGVMFISSNISSIFEP